MRTKKVIETEFWLGDIVYQKVDTDCSPGIVVGVEVVPGNGIKYDVCFQTLRYSFWEIELSGEKCFLPPEYEEDGDEDE